MNTNVFPEVDPFRILESIVSELEVLCADTAVGTRTELIELHAALLVYELGGHSELIPTVGLGFSSRRLLELRVLKAARRASRPQNGSSTPESAMLRAATMIEDLIHLIDPELRILAA